MKIHPAFRKETPMIIEVPRKQRRSPDNSSRFEPYSKVMDENENRTLKPSMADNSDINHEGDRMKLHSVIEEVSLKKNFF